MNQTSVGHMINQKKMMISWVHKYRDLPQQGDIIVDSRFVIVRVTNGVLDSILHLCPIALLEVVLAQSDVQPFSHAMRSGEYPLLRYQSASAEGLLEEPLIPVNCLIV